MKRVSDCNLVRITPTRSARDVLIKMVANLGQDPSAGSCPDAEMRVKGRHVLLELGHEWLTSRTAFTAEEKSRQLVRRSSSAARPFLESL